MLVCQAPCNAPRDEFSLSLFFVLSFPEAVRFCTEFSPALRGLVGRVIPVSIDESSPLRFSSAEEFLLRGNCWSPL